MKFLSLIIPFVLLSALCASPPRAQERGEAVTIAADEDVQVRVLEIHDGDVKLDGRTLPAGHVPSGLSLNGIDMIYHFSGPVTPVLEIDGEVYVLDGDRLIRMEDAAPNRANVYFLGQPEMDAPPSPVTPASSEMPGSPGFDEDIDQAGEDAYLRQLSSRDRPLYDQIQDEQSLELETYRLAGEYRRTDDAEARNQIEEALREMLSESFELKQQIRADEIAQAEAQIGELRRLVGDRSSRKQQIIERRLRELTGKRGQ